ncbi:MAG TPA: ABC transporter ATP-binding protein [Ornithinimicrobium sp.]|uniref:ABC transporter ATP-binding protein n=1 Tax=Ornithinimicrobium sp. TaxID=1977084 RepID=UPI002B4A9709|nr:ABC transporter ATP-binding protein [Ornithinimicrobium sp.]HKJ11694.1 ABC transporter ATP-binding protein [Ornithinimicrobium sp.]
MSGEVAAPVLEVEGLDVATGSTALLSQVSFSIDAGERVGLIGESGSGKSLTALAVMGLLADGVYVRGHVRLHGGPENLLEHSARQWAAVRGEEMSMVFQEPMTALNPTMRVGAQVAEVIRLHRGVSRAEGLRRADDVLEQVGLEAAQTSRAYPHQLSGGQRQRVVVAIALACDPRLLICDEPSTALDVTVQARVLDEIVSGVASRQAALLFITHDLAVVAQVCERVLVMYGGRIVEAGPVREVFAEPRHHYTAGLLAASDLSAVEPGAALPTIEGTVPAAGQLPTGCVFRTRCPAADEACEDQPPWTARAPGSAPSEAFGYACMHPAGETDE